MPQWLSEFFEKLRSPVDEPNPAPWEKYPPGSPADEQAWRYHVDDWFVHLEALLTEGITVMLDFPGKDKAWLLATAKSLAANPAEEAILDDLEEGDLKVFINNKMGITPPPAPTPPPPATPDPAAPKSTPKPRSNKKDASGKCPEGKTECDICHDCFVDVEDHKQNVHGKDKEAQESKTGKQDKVPAFVRRLVSGNNR